MVSVLSLKNHPTDYRIQISASTQHGWGAEKWYTHTLFVSIYLLSDLRLPLLLHSYLSSCVPRSVRTWPCQLNLACIHTTQCFCWQIFHPTFVYLRASYTPTCVSSLVIIISLLSHFLPLPPLFLGCRNCCFPRLWLSFPQSKQEPGKLQEKMWVEFLLLIIAT